MSTYCHLDFNFNSKQKPYNFLKASEKVAHWMSTDKVSIKLWLRYVIWDLKIL